MRRVILIAGVLLAGIELFLLVSGDRVLVGQRHNPELPVSRFSMGEEESYDCAYFTGRKIVRERLWAHDYDECPFIWTYG